MNKKALLSQFYSNKEKKILPEEETFSVIKEPYSRHIEFPLKFNFVKEVLLNLKSSIKLESILFLDVECIELGFSHRNIPYLIGVAYFKGEQLQTELILCHQPAQEEPALEYLISIWKDFQYICTFNGKSFDIPLIKSRFNLFKKRFPNNFLEHFDLYHIIRKTSPHFTNRLIACEKNILGHERKDDLSGSYSGQAYYEYLKYQDDTLLKQIILHNKADVHTLALLCLAMNEYCQSYIKQKVIPLKAPKIYKLSDKNSTFLIETSLENKKIKDGEDYYYLSEIARKKKQRIRATRLAIKAYRLNYSKAIYPALSQLYLYLKKPQLALKIINFILPQEEARVQVKLIEIKEKIERKYSLSNVNS